MIRDSSRRYHLAVWRFAKPTIAAVNGAEFGGGFDLALLCDIRIAGPGAVFAHPEIKIGAPPLFTPLQWIVGAGIARDLCLTGRRIALPGLQRGGAGRRRDADRVCAHGGHRQKIPPSTHSPRHGRTLKLDAPCAASRRNTRMS
jgi:enoyl-CoA hydratase